MVPGVTVHWSVGLLRADVTAKEGIPVTKPARTLVDLAEVGDRRTLERATDEVDRRGLATESQLRAAVARHPGRIGASQLAAVLDQHALGTTATANDFEELFLEVCDEHGFPRPECQVPLLDYRPDFVWREHAPLHLAPVDHQEGLGGRDGRRGARRADPRC